MNTPERSLERIADSLEIIVQILSANYGVVNPKSEKPIDNVVVASLEEEFFKIITKVYIEEEKVKRAKNGQRKSSRRVSVQIGIELAAFFERALPQFNVSSKAGLLLFQKDGLTKAALKCQNDLGYCRGDHWYKYIQKIVTSCENEFKVPNDKVFFLVSSMLNGLENSHVQTVLGTTISNSDLVTQRGLLTSYLTEYVDGITTLQNPRDQVFFAGAEIHPNVLATDWLNTGIEPDFESYSWLKPSVSELVKHLNSIV